jgi:AsmA protein
MSRSSKVILLVAGGLAGLAVLVAAVTALVLRANAKPRLEAVASEALEMEVTVGGRLSVGFLPGLHVALTEVHAQKRDAEIASADEVDVGVELRPLFRREIRIKTIGLKRVRIALERDREGNLNVSKSPKAKGKHPALAVAKVSVSDATLLYVNRQSGKELEAADCNLDVSRLRFSSTEGPDLMKSLSLAAKVDCSRIQTAELVTSEVQLSVDGQDGVFSVDPVAMRLFGGQGSGDVRADLSGAVPVYHVHYGLEKFRIDEFFKYLSPKNAGRKHVGDGSMDFSANLSLRGKTTDALKQSAAGEASLHGENLRLDIGDLDKKFSRYESSQSFNLVDMGAFFFAGPLALGVTKGYDFARILEGSGGSTTIRVLVSNWRIERGVAHATDVAMATKENRVALKGGLDFVNGRFDEVTVALIDAKGCARVKQRIRGPFRQPEVEEPHVLSALTGPARKLLKDVKELFDGKCDVFYAGSVQPPGKPKGRDQ